MGSISIHALTRSATKISESVLLSVLYFNPRTHKECDVGTIDQNQLLVNISIHALTRSATSYGFLFNEPKEDFNPRTHKECDTVIDFTNYMDVYFNPRTHKECDAIFTSIFFTLLLFQSTHSQGVRP